MLEKDMQEQQAKKATHDMERIAHATDKVDLLLTDLLELSRIGRIIEIHDGRIWAESEGLGKGSTFCFTIPNTRSDHLK